MSGALHPGFLNSLEDRQKNSPCGLKQFALRTLRFAKSV
jgi:hypothetical protein